MSKFNSVLKAEQLISKLNNSDAAKAELDAKIAELQKQKEALPADTTYTSGFKPGHAYRCVTSNTSQFTVGDVYMAVRTGAVDEMIPTTGLVSNRARVFNKTKSTFVEAGTWCANPTKKSDKDPVS